MSIAATAPFRARYKSRSPPLAGIDLRIAHGRRIRDLAIGLLQRAGRRERASRHPWPSASIPCDAAIFLELEVERTRRGHGEKRRL
jgi:hypothetical protein